MLRRLLGRALDLPRVRALRGAITVTADDPAAIREATLELIGTLRRDNALRDDEVISAIFTVTPDLRSAFPAETARQAGWQSVPLLCMQEIAVPQGLPRCLRVLVHVERAWGAALPRHVYLRDAAGLRPDLARAANDG